MYVRVSQGVVVPPEEPQVGVRNVGPFMVKYGEIKPLFYLFKDFFSKLNSEIRATESPNMVKTKRKRRSPFFYLT